MPIESNKIIDTQDFNGLLKVTPIWIYTYNLPTSSQVDQDINLPIIPIEKTNSILLLQVIPNFTHQHSVANYSSNLEISLSQYSYNSNSSTLNYKLVLFKIYSSGTNKKSIGTSHAATYIAIPTHIYNSDKEYMFLQRNTNTNNCSFRIPITGTPQSLKVFLRNKVSSGQSGYSLLTGDIIFKLYNMEVN